MNTKYKLLMFTTHIRLSSSILWIAKFLNYILFAYILYLFVCMCMWGHKYTCHYSIHMEIRTTFRSQFSPVMWVLGINWSCQAWQQPSLPTGILPALLMLFHCKHYHYYYLYMNNRGLKMISLSLPSGASILQQKHQTCNSTGQVLGSIQHH